MDRSIPLLLIGLFFGGGIGFTIAAGSGATLDGHDHSDPSHHGAAAATAQPAAGAHGAHAHDMPLELSADAPAPGVALSVAPDPASGWNLRVRVSHFRFAPENASGAHVPGEGHAHLYVNGVKRARLYGEWLHLDRLPEGSTAIEVGLYSNDHRPLHVDGEPVADRIVLEVE